MRVLIVRLSAMGDIIHAMPAVSAMRQLWPEAHLGWAIEERWMPLLTSRPRDHLQGPAGPEQPLVNQIHIINFKQWRRRPFSSATMRAMIAAHRELKAQHYDAAIDLQGAVRSALLAKASGARRVIGEARPREYPASWWFDKKVKTRGEHVIEQAHEIVSALLDHQPPVAKAEFPRDELAEQWAAGFLGGNLRNDLGDNLRKPTRQYAILNPGAGWGAKCWPAERYGVVARKLAEQGTGCLVNVGPGENGLGREVVARSNGSAAMVECSLPQLIALTRGAALFIGGDTGPMHLASALQVPVVGIFGPTDPKRNGPFNSPSVILRHPESKRDHSRRSEPEQGLLTITIEEVVEAALGLLGRK